MKDKVKMYMNRLVTFWKERTNLQKGLFVGSFLLFVSIIIVASVMTGKTNFVPLYSDLSPTETGQIKETLDSKGIKSEIAANGTMIKVPEEVVDTLKVELAAEGIPDSGNIDYSFFGKNAGFGMTDNEFNAIKLKATQTEIINLIKGIDGIRDAKVMITLPEPNVFVGEEKEEASASVVLKTKPGYQFDQNQVKALYHLVSKSVPNLPTDNIVIMNQNFEYFDLKNENNFANGSIIENQLEIKKEVERDIQRRVQQMLGTMMGQDKVVVSVTADLDFTQEKSVQNLVTPVDDETKKGIAISAHKITETYSGEGANAQGNVSTQEGLQGYPAGDSNSNGDYERVEETINNEVNRIQKEIVESPYKVQDLGIQVMVEPPKTDDPATVPTEDIKQILGTIVRTTIDKTEDDTKLTDQDIQEKVVVSVQPFKGKIKFDQPESEKAIPVWIYIAGGVLLFVIIGLIILLFMRKRKENGEIIEEVFDDIQPSIPDVNEEHETEESLRRKQLEKMAKEKPEEFAKILRSWLAED